MLRLDKESLGVEVTVDAEHSFDKVLLEAVEDAFSSLGESGGEAVFFHLGKSFGIKRSEIPFRIDDFSDALEKIFGLGARQLEIRFMKNLFAKVKIDNERDLPESDGSKLTFAEYVRLINENWRRKKTEGAQ